MPDGYMPYYGDEATVLPSNENALLHFSSLFAQEAQQRQAQQAAQQREEQARRLRVQTYLGTRLNDKSFNTDATYQGVIDKNLQSLNDLANQELNAGVPEDQVMAHINNGLLQTKEHANAVNEGDKNIAASVSQILKQYPGVDAAALASLAKHDFHFKKDENGNFVPKGFDELDPNQNYVADAYHNHYPEVYTTEAQQASIPKLFDNQKLQDINEQPTYDANHNLVTPGYKGKLSPLVAIKKDAKGNTVYENGKPVVTVPGATNYRLPGQTEDYVDQNGKTVPVVSDQMYRQYYSGALGSGIEKSVRDQVDKYNQTAKVKMDYDSPYADMLRKNMLYQGLLGEAKNRYQFTTPADKSAQLKHQAFSEAMQRANLSNANARLGIAETALKMKQNKAASGEDIAGYVPDFLGSVNETYGTDAQVEDQPGKPAVNHWFKPNEPAVPATYKTVHIIPATADPKDLNIVAGKANAAGQRPVQPKTFTLKDGTQIKGYEYDPTTGNAIGEGGVEINKQSVQREFLNHMKKGVLDEIAPDTKTPVQKVINKVKAVGDKIKGSSKKMY
jgi:hypothetical protein